MELLLTRGVEIVAALAFVLVLLKSLKGPKSAGAKGGSGARGGAGGADTEPQVELDPALVARAQIDELVKSNPRKVGEILSRWASEDTVGAR